MAERDDGTPRTEADRGRRAAGRRSRQDPWERALDALAEGVLGHQKRHREWREHLEANRPETPAPPERPRRRRSSRPRGSRRAAGSERRPKRERTPEEKAYRAAVAAANQRIGFMVHGVAFAATLIFLLFVGGFRVATIVALAWGIGLACHWFVAIAAPRVRKRIVETEVSERLMRDVPQARRALETQQAKRVEELSASIAHEIRNPITAAKSLVQQMGEDPSSGDNVEYAGVALQELERVERSISHLLRFAREEDIEIREIEMRDVIESAIETFRDRLGKTGVTVELETESSGAMRGDAEKLRRVVINLLGNALDAFDEGSTEAPSISIQAGENLAGTEVWVRIKDNGPGMDPERLAKIFSPFYTSKDTGTGLGPRDHQEGRRRARRLDRGALGARKRNGVRAHLPQGRRAERGGVVLNRAAHHSRRRRSGQRRRRQPAYAYEYGRHA